MDGAEFSTLVSNPQVTGRGCEIEPDAVHIVFNHFDLKFKQVDKGQFPPQKDKEANVRGTLRQGERVLVRVCFDEGRFLKLARAASIHFLSLRIEN